MEVIGDKTVWIIRKHAGRNKYARKYRRLVQTCQDRLETSVQSVGFRADLSLWS